MQTLTESNRVIKITRLVIFLLSHMTIFSARLNPHAPSPDYFFT